MLIKVPHGDVSILTNSTVSLTNSRITHTHTQWVCIDSQIQTKPIKALGLLWRGVSQPDRARLTQATRLNALGRDSWNLYSVSYLGRLGWLGQGSIPRAVGVCGEQNGTGQVCFQFSGSNISPVLHTHLSSLLVCLTGPTDYKTLSIYYILSIHYILHHLLSIQCMLSQTPFLILKFTSGASLNKGVNLT